MICRIKVISIGLRPEIMGPLGNPTNHGDRKSTRLNSSHGYISYAVFCLKKKKSMLVVWRLPIPVRCSHTLSKSCFHCDGLPAICTQSSDTDNRPGLPEYTQYQASYIEM